MASNETPNFHLNQWEPEDTVLRQEFNADNAKIDQALQALKEPSIRTGVLTSYNGSNVIGMFFHRRPSLVAVGNRLGWTNIITGSSSTSRPGHAVALPNYPGYISGTSSETGSTMVLEITSSGFTIHAGLDPDLAPYHYVALFDEKN